MIDILAFTLATLLVLTGAGAASFALRPGECLDTVLAWATLGITQITVSMLIAGVVLRELTAPSVIAVNAGLTAAVLIAVPGRSFGLTRLRETGPRLRAFLARLPTVVRAHPWPSTLVAFALAQLFWRALSGYLLPPYGFDALWYHLTTVGAWLQEGQITLSPFNQEGPAAYPANTELTFAWVALLLGGDALVNVVQVGFAALGALAVAGIGRTAGLSPAGASAAGALFFLTPVVLVQSTTNYVDVAFTSVFVISLHFLFRFEAGLPTGRARTGSGSGNSLLVEEYRRHANRSLLLMAGIAAGFAVGSKATGLLYVGAAAGTLVVYLCIRRAHGEASTRSTLAAAATFVVPFLVLGSFWYVRNWVEQGNPLYPVEVRVLGTEVFDGPMTYDDVISSTPGDAVSDSPFVRIARSWAHDLSPWTQEEYYRYDQRSGGLGPPWTYLGIPLVALLALIAVRKERRLLYLLGPIAVMFLLQPYQWWARHTLILAVVGAVAIVYFAERWERQVWARTIKIAAIPLVGISMWWATARIELGTPSSLSPVELASRVNSADERTLAKIARLSEYRWLENASEGLGIGVDPDSTKFYAPLYGSSFDNRVYALSPPEPSALQTEVASKNIRYLFLRRNGRFDRWAQQALPGLRLVFEGGGYRQVVGGGVAIRVYQIEK